ncbi:uncharacterized protein CPUR_01351 [Claviceps purpurea 20.1]|uniref:F-box domain-containing protein n=1 Tax=Claviceps purpurea (strain 20.1) TaxID=1111077 RepID=M1VUJ4_CLAP2|nr:uncharacterized protein CPUR_01351 [Claviceps purpurea 20.1]
MLPNELKIDITDYLPLKSLALLGQTCKAWHQFVEPELYARDAEDGNSFAIKWMAAHAVDEQSTEIALKTLKTSVKFKGKINAIQLDVPQQQDGGISYEGSTALHYALILGNLRLTEKLLSMGARFNVPCLGGCRALKATSSQGLSSRLEHSHSESILAGYFEVGHCLPTFVALIKSDRDRGGGGTGQLLIKQGAKSYYMMIDFQTGPKKRMSIRQLAVVNTTAKDSRKFSRWRSFFDSFGQHTNCNEGCVLTSVAPFRVDFGRDCYKGVRISVNPGANMEIRNGALQTSLTDGVLPILQSLKMHWRVLQRHIKPLQLAVELEGSVDPDGNSILVPVNRHDEGKSVALSDVKFLIDFFQSHGVDFNSFNFRSSPVAIVLIRVILSVEGMPSTSKVLKDLLIDLVACGLDLTESILWEPSPLCTIIHNRDARPAWLFNFLCKKGATIAGLEVDAFFLRWCQIPRLWAESRYNISQHAKQISPAAVARAYEIALSAHEPSLYTRLMRMPLAAPSNLELQLVRSAFVSKNKWSWRMVVRRKFAGNFITSTCCGEENLAHLTVRVFQRMRDYSATNAIEDISGLIRKGVDITSQNLSGQNPRELLLSLACDRPDAPYLRIFLKREIKSRTDGNSRS